MKKLLTILCMILFLAIPVMGFAMKNNEIPQTTVEGLELVPDTSGIALVWAEPSADFSQYKRIYLVDPYVAFKKNWEKTVNSGTRSKKVKASDMERIKTELAGIFLEVFAEELEAGGYTLAQERAEDVLILKPAIIDLYVSAPDVQTSSRSYTFTTNNASMALYMEIYDSETGDILAKALDSTSGRDSTVMHWQTQGSNRAAAKGMIKPWAQALRGALDSSRESGKQEK